MLSSNSNICCFCGWVKPRLLEDMKFNPLLLPHLGDHMNAFVKLVDDDGIAIVRIKYETHRSDCSADFACAADRFPQLCMIRASNEEEFDDKISDISLKCDQSGMDINFLFDEISKRNDEIYDEIVDLITRTEYVCGLCEMSYESGLPSIEVASKHALCCISQQQATPSR